MKYNPFHYLSKKLKKKPDWKSLRIKIWVYVMLFSLAIIMLLWMMQITFINGYYKSMKRQNITEAAKAIEALYLREQGNDLVAKLEDIADNSDLFVIITDTNGMSIYKAEPEGRDYRTPMENFGQGYGRPKPQDDDMQNPYLSLAEQILAQPEGKLIQNIDFPGRQMMLYGNTMVSSSGEKALLMISSPLQPLTETVKILSQQLVYITLTVFVLALVVSIIIAKHVSRPIVRIKDKALLLAQGKYDTKFDHGEYTEVNQLADTLNHTASALQQVETLRNELVANVSHDLRTPLTMIRVYAEMIRDLYRNKPEKRDENVGVIIEECDRLTSLVQNLLDLSKLEAGVDTLHPGTFDLTQTIRRILPRYKLLMQKDGYRIQFAQDQPKWVTADESRIEQVLHNLLNNAVNYTGEDKRISIAVADKGDHVRVLISDTGDGIDPKNIDLIWDRYYMADKEHKRAVTGSGLGLSIVKSIMDLHGTRYGVDSILHQGSTFWFELKKAGD